MHVTRIELSTYASTVLGLEGPIQKSQPHPAIAGIRPKTRRLGFHSPCYGTCTKGSAATRAPLVKAGRPLSRMEAGSENQLVTSNSKARVCSPERSLPCSVWKSSLEPSLAVDSLITTIDSFVLSKILFSFHPYKSLRIALSSPNLSDSFIDSLFSPATSTGPRDPSLLKTSLRHHRTAGETLTR